MGVYARQILEQVVNPIPVLLYTRTLAIWFVSVFLVFKLASLGAEIYQLKRSLQTGGFGCLEFSGPPPFGGGPQVTAKALEMADCIGAITAEALYARLRLASAFKQASLQF